jgi:hypothetical protein
MAGKRSHENMNSSSHRLQELSRLTRQFYTWLLTYIYTIKATAVPMQAANSDEEYLVSADESASGPSEASDVSSAVADDCALESTLSWPSPTVGAVGDVVPDENVVVTKEDVLSAVDSADSVGAALVELSIAVEVGVSEPSTWWAKPE